MSDDATTPASLHLVTTNPSTPSTSSSSPSSTQPTPRSTHAMRNVPQLPPDANVVVTLVNSDGPHPVWDDTTYRWFMPVLGPSACAVMPALYSLGATPHSALTVEDLAFMSGVGVGQLAKTLLRLCDFHAITDCGVEADTVTISMPTHLPAVGHRMRASWPAWYGRAYDEEFAK